MDTDWSPNHQSFFIDSDHESVKLIDTNGNIRTHDDDDDDDDGIAQSTEKFAWKRKKEKQSRINNGAFHC